MMGNLYGNMMGSFGLGALLVPFIWIALLVFLILGSIYFWKQINKK